MSEKRFEVDGVEVERFMLVFGDDGTRIVDDQTGKELYAIDIVGLLNEQQDTISQLQDLCGQSDGENAKLRIENKKLKDDLHNCRLNKNIIREKLKMWQDVHKEHNIYSIKDFEKLMKKVK